MSFSQWYLRVQDSDSRDTRRRLAGNYIATNLHRNQSQISVRESVGKGKSRGTVITPTRQGAPLKTIDFHEDFPYRHPALQGEDSDRGKQSVLADVPASMGDVEYHPIRASPLHLKVARTTWTHGSIESILLSESLPVDLFELLRGLCEVIH